MLLPVAVCLAVYSYEKPITDPTVMANIEALTDADQPDLKDCISDPEYDCWSLHPTDPSKDKIRPDHRW